MENPTPLLLKICKQMWLFHHIYTCCPHSSLRWLLTSSLFPSRTEALSQATAPHRQTERSAESCSPRPGREARRQQEGVCAPLGTFFRGLFFNLPTIKVTIPEHTVWWFSIYSQGWATTTPNSKTISPPMGKTSVLGHHPQPQPVASQELCLGDKIF